MSQSALLGAPPNTEEDFFIARGLIYFFGLEQVLDPQMGAQIAPPPPPPELYVSETRGPAIAAGALVTIIVSVVITGARLLLRKFKRGLKWGLDDWLIIPGLVRASSPSSFAIHQRLV